MERLRTIDSLCNIEERDGCALKGDLVCSCGNDWFVIWYYGKRTKGLFFTADLVRKHGKMLVEARCSVCNEKNTVFDSDSMGRQKSHKNVCPKEIEFPLIPFETRPVKIRLLYNYFPEKMHSIHFEDIFIEIDEANGRKWKRIVEE
jgi:hypothetical protein